MPEVKLVDIIYMDSRLILLGCTPECTSSPTLIYESHCRHIKACEPGLYSGKKKTFA